MAGAPLDCELRSSAADDEPVELAAILQDVTEMRRHLVATLIGGERAAERPVLEWLVRGGIAQRPGCEPSTLKQRLASSPVLRHVCEWFMLDVTAGLLTLLPNKCMEDHPPLHEQRSASQSESPAGDAEGAAGLVAPAVAAAAVSLFVSGAERRQCLVALLSLVSEYPSAATTIRALYPLLVDAGAAPAVRRVVGSSASTAAASLAAHETAPSHLHIADTLQHSRALHSHRPLVQALLSTIVVTRPRGVEALLSTLLLTGVTEAEEDAAHAARRVALLVATPPTRIVDLAASTARGCVVPVSISLEAYHAAVGPQVVRLLRLADTAAVDDPPPTDATQEPPAAPVALSWFTPRTQEAARRPPGAVTVGQRLRGFTAALLNELLQKRRGAAVSPTATALGRLDTPRIALTNRSILGPCWGCLRLARQVAPAELSTAIDALVHFVEGAALVGAPAAFSLLWSAVGPAVFLLGSAAPPALVATDEVGGVAEAARAAIDAVIDVASSSVALGATKRVAAALVRAALGGAAAARGEAGSRAAAALNRPSFDADAPACLLVGALQKGPGANSPQRQELTAAVFAEALTLATVEAQLSNRGNGGGAGQGFDDHGGSAGTHTPAGSAALVAVLLDAVPFDRLVFGRAAGDLGGGGGLGGGGLAQLLRCLSLVAGMSFRGLRVACGALQCISDDAVRLSVQLSAAHGTTMTHVVAADFAPPLRALRAALRADVVERVALLARGRDATDAEEAVSDDETRALEAEVGAARIRVEALTTCLEEMEDAAVPHLEFPRTPAPATAAAAGVGEGDAARGGSANSSSLARMLDEVHASAVEAQQAVRVGAVSEAAVAVRDAVELVGRLTSLPRRTSSPGAAGGAAPPPSPPSLHDIDALSTDQRRAVREAFARIGDVAVEIAQRTDDAFTFLGCVQLLSWSLLHRLDSPRCTHVGGRLVLILGAPTPAQLPPGALPFRPAAARWALTRQRVLEVLLCVADHDADGATLRCLDDLGLWQSLELCCAAPEAGNVALHAAALHVIGALHIRLHARWPVFRLTHLVTDVFRAADLPPMCRAAAAALLSHVAASVSDGSLPPSALPDDQIPELRRFGEHLRRFSSAAAIPAATGARRSGRLPAELLQMSLGADGPVDDDAIIRAHGARIVDSLDAVRSAIFAAALAPDGAHERGRGERSMALARETQQHVHECASAASASVMRLM